MRVECAGSQCQVPSCSVRAGEGTRRASEAREPPASDRVLACDCARLCMRATGSGCRTGRGPLRPDWPRPAIRVRSSTMAGRSGGRAPRFVSRRVGRVGGVLEPPSLQDIPQCLDEDCALSKEQSLELKNQLRVFRKLPFSAKPYTATNGTLNEQDMQSFCAAGYFLWRRGEGGPEVCH